MWSSVKFKNLEKFCWLTCFYSTIWSIWGGRNDLVLKNKAFIPDNIVDLSKTRMAFWIKARFKVDDYTVDDFKRCLDGIRKIKI